jgi:protein TonB
MQQGLHSSTRKACAMSIELSLATAQALPRRQMVAPKLQRPAPAANDEQVQCELIPLQTGVRAKQRKDFSASVLAVVIAAHILTIGVLLYQSSLELVEMPQAEPAAMMVSLVSNPAQETEPDVVPEVIEVPPEPQPVKPVVKKLQPVKQIVEPQPVQDAPTALSEPAPEAASEPAAPADTAPPSVAMAEKSAEVPVVVEPPRYGAAYLHNPPPIYPPVSRRLGEEGRVMLRVLVSADGTAQSVEIENSSGSDRLDRAASDAVKTWLFIPAKRDKQPISAQVIVPIQFSLNS